MVETFINYPIVKDALLPFLLVFAIVFAVLQKTEILGKDKKQADAIVALVSGLLVITVGRAVFIIGNLIPFMAIALIVLFAFFLVWGLAFKQGEFKIEKSIQIFIGGAAAVAVGIAILIFSGGWEWLKEVFAKEAVWPYVLIIAGIIGALWIGLGGGKGGKEKEKEKEGG